MKLIDALRGMNLQRQQALDRDEGWIKYARRGLAGIVPETGNVSPAAESRRLAFDLAGAGNINDAVKALSDRLADKEPETRAAVLQALMWLVQGDPAAARQLVPLIPKLEQQVAADRGRQDYAATNEQLRRLITEVRRRGEQA